jgi:hypothetical protein
MGWKQIGGQTRRRFVTALLLFAWSASARGAQQIQLRQGDVLVSDTYGSRILYVDTQAGTTTDFSPRAGSGTNLLQRPSGIAIDPDGPIFVVDEQTNRLISIDPSTGVQSVVHEVSIVNGDLGPLNVGTAPRGLRISPDTPGCLGCLRELYISESGAIYEVTRGAFIGTSAVMLSNDPLLTQDYNDIAVNESGGNLIALYVTGYGGIASYDANSQAVSNLLSSTEVLDADYAADLFFVQQSPCSNTSTASGLYDFHLPSGPSTAISTGGSLMCPTAARAVSPTEFVVTDYYGGLVDVFYSGGILTLGSSNAPSAKQPRSLPSGWYQTPLASLPIDAFAFAVSPTTFPVPEPGSGLEAIAVLLAVTAQCRRRSRPLGNGKSCQAS